MGRKILAVILGYGVMLVLVMGVFHAAYLVLGADKAFEAGTYESTPMWMGVWLGLSVVAAVSGGFVCGKIGKSKGAVISLMVLVGVLGAADTVRVLSLDELAAEDQIRVGDTTGMEAMKKGQAPTWVAFAQPLIGVFGAMVGASMGCGCRKEGCEIAGVDGGGESEG